MVNKERTAEQETQHEKKAASRKDERVDSPDEGADIEQETQHQKRKAAKKGGEN